MNETAKKILQKLNDNGFKAYLVGGYVRDLLLGSESNDIDICTNAQGKDLISLFSGKENGYGSFNVQVNKYNIDITTFRKENSYQNSKLVDYVFIDELEQDLLRRDFTINTICMDARGKVYDFWHGIDDLNHNIIKAVGDADTRLKEDPLRILRAIRFATVLDFELDKNLETAIIKNKNLIKTISYYRVKEEVSRILLSLNFQKGLDLLKKYGLDNILQLSYVHVIYTKDLYGMWAQIQYPESYPFTKQEKEIILNIQDIIKDGSITNGTLYHHGLYLCLVAGEILGIDKNTIYKINDNIPIHERKDLAISYLELGTILDIKPSKKLKEIEKEIIDKILHGHIKNTKNEIKNYLLDNKERWNSDE